jgi:uncharacterized C2H2 Zn-finger protein
MSDFIKFCPKCYTLFRDADLYQQHVAQCGTIKEKEAAKEAKKTADSRRQADCPMRTTAEGERDGRLPMGDESSDEPGNGSQKEMVQSKPEMAEDESAAASAEGDRTPDPAPPQRKSPKFKT